MPAPRRDWSTAEDNAIFALRALGWSGAKIAAALERSPISLERHLTRLRKRGSTEKFRDQQTYPRLRPEDDPIDGEEWCDVPVVGLSISSACRVKSLSTGFLRRQHKEAHTGNLAVNFEVAGKKSTITIARLLMLAAGQPLGNPYRRYSAEEDDVIRAASTLAEVRRRLPHRAPAGLIRRARQLGVTLKQATKSQGRSPQRKLPLDFDAITNFASRYPLDRRGDLVGQVAVIIGNGFTGDLSAAFKAANTELNRLSNPFRDISFDAPIRGTDDLKLSDVIASDRPHF